MVNIPSISVVMSAYNAEQYIAEAIGSILSQTYKDFEFIIIDDASTDNTLSIINRIQDKRIKVLLNEKNIGLAASLNKGFREARGKYIARMDADDISHVQRLEKLYDFLEQNPGVDVCGTAMQLFGAEKGVSGKDLITDSAIKAELIWGCAMAHATMLIRTEVVKEHNLFYDETFRVGQDWKFWYDVKNHVTLSNLNEPLYLYRRGVQNITFQYKHQAKERYAVMHRLMLNDLGISFSEHELKLHQFIIGLFSLSPSPGVIREAKAWLEKLIAYNKKIKKHDTDIFKSTAMRHWSRLFYLIVPYGYKTVFAYFDVTGVTWMKLSYYLKYSINKFIGRK